MRNCPLPVERHRFTRPQRHLLKMLTPVTFERIAQEAGDLYHQVSGLDFLLKLPLMFPKTSGL